MNIMISDECSKHAFHFMQEREKVRQLGNGDIEKIISLAKEICSIKEVAAFLSIQCPCCGIGITCVSGCNSMVCGNCGKPFCYGCGVVGCHGCSLRCTFLIICFLVLNYGLSTMLSGICFLDTNSEIWIADMPQGRWRRLMLVLSWGHRLMLLKRHRKK